MKYLFIVILFIVGCTSERSDKKAKLKEQSVDSTGLTTKQKIDVIYNYIVRLEQTQLEQAEQDKQEKEKRVAEEKDWEKSQKDLEELVASCNAVKDARIKWREQCDINFPENIQYQKDINNLWQKIDINEEAREACLWSESLPQYPEECNR